MIVTLKTLQEDIFTVEIDPSQTVKYFKEKIEKVKGDEFPAKNMKLMYAGKFLVDNKKVSDYNVEEKKFVIVVVKKSKFNKKVSDYNVEEKKFVIVAVKKPKPATVVKEEPDAESSSDALPQLSPQPQERSNFVNGQRNNDEALILQITELGFTRAEVQAALNASYNNPDRAVEYLLSNSLPSSSMEDAETEARRRNPDYISDSADAALVRQISHSGPISPGMPNQERIMSIFANAVEESESQIRAAQSLIDQQRDLITQNFAEIEAAEMALNSRSSGAAANSPPFPPSNLSDSGLFSSDRMFESFSSAFHEAHALSFAGNLLDRDHEAIERLKQLGFSDHKAIEAYFVCERNENAAADYLFSQNFE